MALSMLPLKASLRPRFSVPFSGFGGVEPYTFQVLPNGAGGTIGVNTGVYTAPNVVGDNPAKSTDTIRVTDSAVPVPATFDATVYLRNPLQILCGILEQELQLAEGRVYLAMQKIFEPTDQGLFIAVRALVPKAFGVSNGIDAQGNEIQSVNMKVNCEINLISRDLSALNRQGEVIMALSSIYSQQQQEANAMSVAPLQNNFVNLSEMDGSAIPYRFNISVNVQYSEVKIKAAPYFDQFGTPEITTEP